MSPVENSPFDKMDPPEIQLYDGNGYSNTTAFVMTPAREKAALLLAIGDMSIDEVAAAINSAVSTVRVWNRFPAFKQEVRRIRDEILEEIRLQGISSKANRLKIYNDLAKSALSIIEANRKAYGANPRAPGDESGLIGERFVDTRSDGVISEYYYLDNIVRSIQSVLKQAAQELGEWDEKGSTMDVRVLVARVSELEGLTEEERQLVEQKSMAYLSQMGV